MGLILGVTPRISPDGLVVMEIDAEKSDAGARRRRASRSPSSGGQVIRSPHHRHHHGPDDRQRHERPDGGPRRPDRQEQERVAPQGAAGWATFRCWATCSATTAPTSSRTELLIIMTPHIVRNEADADAIKQAEAARMSWCLCDVTNIHGEAGLRRRTDDWSDGEIHDGLPGREAAAAGRPAAAAAGRPGTGADAPGHAVGKPARPTPAPLQRRGPDPCVSVDPGATAGHRRPARSSSAIPSRRSTSRPLRPAPSSRRSILVLPRHPVPFNRRSIRVLPYRRHTPRCRRRWRLPACRNRQPRSSRQSISNPFRPLKPTPKSPPIVDPMSRLARGLWLVCSAVWLPARLAARRGT